MRDRKEKLQFAPPQQWDYGQRKRDTEDVLGNEIRIEWVVCIALICLNRIG